MRFGSTLCAALLLACGQSEEQSPGGGAGGKESDGGGRAGTSGTGTSGAGGSAGGASGTSAGGTSSGGTSTGGASGGGTAGSSAGSGGANPAPTADFDTRCKAPGVIVCRGFDADSELNRINTETQTGAEADGSGSMSHISIDKTVKASGAGALRFEIVGRSGANHSGAFRQLMGRAFGEGTAFYAQFRLRLSSTFIQTPWDSVVGSSPKIVIFHHSSATCNDIEWTQVMNGWYDHIATMYTHCGQYQPGSGSTQYFQQGDYNCPYGADYANDPGCLKYTPEKWMTFYFKATMGTWGQPTSHLEAWVGVDGQPYKQWIDDPTFTLYAEGESVAGFNSVYLTTYMTAKDASADHPTAYAWYDELIVSTQPIAPPSK